MFTTPKVQSVIWMSRTHGGDRRRDFRAKYLFDDGFPGREECVAKLTALGFSPDEWVLICFCGNWYAVNMWNYHQHSVLTAEHIHCVFGIGGAHTVFSHEESTERMEVPLAFDIKRWQDGIECDLLTIDPCLLVEHLGYQPGFGSIVHNNALICFGIHFFVTEICINTDEYLEHVLGNYFSDRSMAYMSRDIDRMRLHGIGYYNPFRKTVSADDRERQRKEKELFEAAGVEMPKDTDTIVRPWEGDGMMRFKRLKRREADPPSLRIVKGSKWGYDT